MLYAPQVARGRAVAAPRRVQSVIAAATRVKISDKKLAERQAGKRQSWQVEAWAYFDEVPELKQATWFLGNAMSKLRLFVGYRPDDAGDDEEPINVLAEESEVPPAIAQAAVDELARLRGELGGKPALLRRMNMNLEIAGEGFLVGRAAVLPDAAGEGGRPESWQFCSISEIDKKGADWIVKDGPNDTKGEKLDPETDTIIRIWQEHPQWGRLADSAMRGVLGECKALQVLSQQVVAQAMRAASAGFLTLPNELSFGGADDVEPEDGEEASVDPFVEEMEKALLGPVEDPSDPNSVQPGLIRGPAEFLKPDYLRHLKFWDPSIDASLEERIKARIERLARGLNLPVEVVMGHQATTFANAEQVDQDTFEDHLQPRCELIVDALTVGFLRPNLTDANVAAEWVDRIVVWYDASDLIAQPDVEKNADRAHTLNLISDAAARAALGFNEDDAPEALELIIRAGLRRGILTAELTAALIQKLADEAGVDLPSPAELAPGAGGGAPPASSQMQELAELLLVQQTAARLRDQPALPATSRRAITASARVPVGRDLMEIDRDLRSRLTVAANDSMRHALDRAGSILRSRSPSNRAILRDVPKNRVAATLGYELSIRAATTDEALDGAWDELERQFMAWGAAAQSDALETASRIAGGFTIAERDAYMLRQADDLATAWAWLKDALSALAAQRMFDPDPAAPEFGEFDPTLQVPVGMLRQAIARAGGTSGLLTNDAGGAYVVLGDSGRRPAGGIGTGELLRDAMRDHGVATEGYRWVYGPASRHRPFEPHRELDGVEFVNFDDDVLANTSGFPDGAFYLPGDHQGCICDVEPILIPPDEVSGA